MAVAAAAVLTAGCTSAVDRHIAAAHGSPVSGGTVRIATTNDLTPSLVYSGTKSSETTLTGLVYNELISYPPEGLEPRPELAEGWSVSPDGTVISLDLRRDVTFHDGRPFTSRDVAFSLRAYSDPANAGQLARVAQLIETINTDDPHRVVLTLSRPANNIFDLLAVVPIIDENSFEEWKHGKSYIGTGPFMFERWYPGSRVEFKANRGYWGGPPHIDGVDMLVTPDQKTQFSQLRSGSIDVLADSVPRDVAALDGNPAFKVVSAEEAGSMVYLGANVSTPALQDPRVREAISLAIDRHRIVSEVYLDRARATVLPWSEYSPAYDGMTDSASRNVERARELLGGSEAPRRITLSFASDSLEHRTVAQIIADNLSEIGIDVELEPTEYAAMISQLRSGSFPGLWVLGHGFSQYNPSTLVTSAFPFNAAKNSSNFSDPDYSSAVEASWNTPDPSSESARQSYWALNAELVSNAFVMEIAAPETAVITAGNLHDVTWTKRGELDLSAAYFTR
ncbi:ABC transporter substrate-binding protein [Corynebacterium liangguodongii]|uniref:ABC transporter substrate-binding protein n=1 Tax=Corynebacterium liangguodongii TaxID=2079535 RepID=UPI001304D7BA|nr:ABC transporter substrate-binding protein [Corynebacterium liangguodongii]